MQHILPYQTKLSVGVPYLRGSIIQGFTLTLLTLCTNNTAGQFLLVFLTRALLVTNSFHNLIHVGLLCWTMVM